MATRELTDRDEPELERFVLMAAFSPDAPIPGGARAMTHVRRWLDGWSALEAGVCWEEDDCVLGAAWARRVEPILVRTALGQAVPEVVIAVDPDRRGRGIGRALMEGLVASTEEAGEPGLCLSVSAKNASAVRLYERVGFVPIGERRTHLITMVLELEDQVERRFCSAREQVAPPRARGCCTKAFEKCCRGLAGARMRAAVRDDLATNTRAKRMEWPFSEPTRRTAPESRLGVYATAV